MVFIPLANELTPIAIVVSLDAFELAPKAIESAWVVLAFNPTAIDLAEVDAVLAFGPIAIESTPDAPVLFWLPVTFDLTEK